MYLSLQEGNSYSLNTDDSGYTKKQDSQLDRTLLLDKREGFINEVSTEYLCRRCWALECAFADCKVKSDWLKPRNNAPKDWKSKVKWDEIKRLDPSQVKNFFLLNREVEEEARGEIDRDAMLLKSRAKPAAQQPEAKDPLNPV